MSQNGKSAGCLELGHSSLAAALGNEAPPPKERIVIGDPEERKRRDGELSRRPVTEEAHARLTETVPGAHRRINYLPIFRLGQFAVAMGRQIERSEIDFFVGVDGETNSAVCAEKLKWRKTKIEHQLSRRKTKLEQDLAIVDHFDPALVSEEEKTERKHRLNEEATAEIAILERHLEDVEQTCRFTPMFWVDPNMNPCLLEELRRNGGNVKEAFITCGLNLEIAWSGCFYTFKAVTVAFSGSPFFYDVKTGRTTLSSFPLGKMAIRHPRARNKQEDIDLFLSSKDGSAKEIQLRWFWGFAQKERERQEALEQQRISDLDPALDDNLDIIGDIIAD